MTKKQILFIVTIIAMIVTIVYLAIAIKQPAPQYFTNTPFSNTQSLSSFGGCSQCLGNQCYAAPCNMDCRPVGDGCETIVAGGGEGGMYSPETKAANGDYAEFFMQGVIKNNNAMVKAGIKVGDVVERVNGIYAGSDLEFAKLVLHLPNGTVLKVKRSNGKTENITL